MINPKHSCLKIDWLRYLVEKHQDLLPAGRCEAADRFSASADRCDIVVRDTRCSDSESRCPDVQLDVEPRKSVHPLQKGVLLGTDLARCVVKVKSDTATTFRDRCWAVDWCEAAEAGTESDRCIQMCRLVSAVHPMLFFLLIKKQFVLFKWAANSHSWSNKTFKNTHFVSTVL